jgi:hypothetical protein
VTVADQALDVLASLVLETGARWGEVAEPAQWEDARAVLSGAEPRRHWLGRSRGRSKTSDVAGLTVAAMVTGLLPPGSMAYAAAADQDQAGLLRKAMQGQLIRTPELHGALTVGARQVVCERTDVVLEVLAADASSAYGLLPAWLVVDELCQWPDTVNAREFWVALSTGLPKVAGSRGVVMTTAGSPSHWSHKVYEHALADELWRVSELSGPAPWMDPREVAGERRRLTDAQYRRLFLNEWVEAEDRLARPEDLRACVRIDGPLSPAPGRWYVVALDIGLTNDRTVLAVCHAEMSSDLADDRVRVVLDRMHVWQGSRDKPVQLEAVEAVVWESLLEYGRYIPAAMVADPYQAAQLCQRMRERGAQVSTFTFSASSVGRLGAQLYTLIRERLLVLPDDEDLLDELAHVRLRESAPGVFRLDHDSGRHDDRAVCLAMAAATLLEPVDVEYEFVEPRVQIGVDV